MHSKADISGTSDVLARTRVELISVRVKGGDKAQKKTIVSGLRARHFKTSASMFFLIKKKIKLKKKNYLVFQLQKSM